MKWEPLAAMGALLALGVWIVIGPSVRYDTRPGAALSRLQIGNVRGELETVREPGGDHSFRLLYRDGSKSRVLAGAEMKDLLGPANYQAAVDNAGNTLFRLLNVTSWGGMVWVVVGLGGQLAFAGRWLIQWFVSERRRESYIPASFWWTSLCAGVILFAYFAWRQDLVGVLGQTSGIVVYARNIRLINKKARRDARPPRPPLEAPHAPSAPPHAAEPLSRTPI